MTIIKCIKCKKEKAHKSKHMCIQCYSKYRYELTKEKVLFKSKERWRLKKREIMEKRKQRPPKFEICLSCKKIQKIHIKGLCAKCYYKGKCTLCNKDIWLFKKSSGYCMSCSKKGKRHYNWKEDNVGYSALHIWIKSRKPKPKLCECCKKSPPYDLANISGGYKRDIKDFEWLCRKCHMTKDGRLKELIKNRRNRL